MNYLNFPLLFWNKINKVNINIVTSKHHLVPCSNFLPTDQFEMIFSWENLDCFSSQLKKQFGRAEAVCDNSKLAREKEIPAIPCSQLSTLKEVFSSGGDFLSVCCWTEIACWCLRKYRLTCSIDHFVRNALQHLFWDYGFVLTFVKKRRTNGLVSNTIKGIG